MFLRIVSTCMSVYTASRATRQRLSKSERDDHMSHNSIFIHISPIQIPWSCNWHVWTHENTDELIWCDFNRASSLICGNKMPTRCNRGFYCRSYCLLNMFRAPLCPSSGAQEYYTVVAACGISCCGFEVAGLVWSWGLCVRFAGCAA